MNKSIKVIYENGILRPLEPVLFHEHQQVTVMILDEHEISFESKKETLYDIALRNGMIGIVDDLLFDLSTNPLYLEGLGRESPSDPC